MKLFFYFGLLLFGGQLIGQETDYAKQLDSLYSAGYEQMYTAKDSSYRSFDEMYKLATKKEDWNSTSDALMGKVTVADYHNQLSTVKKSLDLLDSLFLKKKEYFDDNPETILYKNLFNYHKGNYYFSLNDFDKSRVIFSETIENTEKLPDSMFQGDYIGNASYLSLAYSYMAKMDSGEGKLDLSLEYYEKVIRYIITKVPEDKKRLYGNYGLVAEVLKKKGEFEKANSYLLKTLNYNIADKNQYSIATVLNIVQNHNSLAQIDSSEYYLNIAKNLLDKNDPSLSSYHQVNAETHQAKGNYDLAVVEFKKAHQLIQEKWNGKKHWEIAHFFNKLGLLHTEFNNPEKAIENFDLGMEQFEDSGTAINQSKMVEILKNKAKALNQIESKSEETILAVDMGIALLDSLKPTFKSHSDKLLLIEDAFPLFESGLKAAFDLYNSTKDEKYLDQAFLYSEKSKSVLLMEALLASKATEFANMPADLLEREKQLKAEINNNEKQLNSDQDDTSLKDKLFDLKKEYRNLVAKIESDFRAYYDLKYNSDVISIAETQKLLSNDEQLISYFYGNNSIYAITITSGSKHIHKIPLAEKLDAQITEIYGMLSDPKSDASALARKTHVLYNHILAPALVSSEKKKLMIIAGGLLNYIPFGALNTAANGISYLAKDKSVAYANSATLLRQLKDKPATNQRIMAFAPGFENSMVTDNSSHKLLPLPHNKREVEQIMNSFEGSSFLGNNASLKNFASEISNFGIVHLATHAIFDDASPEYSYLAFSPRKSEDYLLYVRDLYNMQLNADLITLSACETGVGELKRGEGFMGLARGFFYGGASSISSTLWKVNDASSTELMDFFYKNLAEGDTKDLALQKAKKAFLNTNSQNALSHPYYWSGYVLSGNTRPIVAKSNLALILLGFSIVMGGGFFLYKRRAA